MTQSLKGKTAWVTGAGTGIGEASALALAGAGASVVLSGRRREPLDGVAERIRANGGEALVMPGDMSDAKSVAEIAGSIAKRGPLDILFSNAGTNLPRRRWDELTPESIASLVDGNLNAALYVASACLPLMRKAGGLMIHTGSWAAHFISAPPGGVYTAAKSAVVAMSHSINLEENVNNIRSCVLSPGDVRTPLMNQRPTVISAEARAQMLDPTEVADIVLYLACLPARVCITEVIVGPTRAGG
jgi:NADP-dependent 3-hydroxy acid dehydrogenase YdfG